MSEELEAAEATARGLREQIAELVHAHARADEEAKRLAGRATLPGADPSMNEIAQRYERHSGVLGTEIEGLRASLREAEADLERLRADDAGV